MIQSILNKSTLYWAIGARRLALASPPGDTTSERLSAWRCRPKKCRRRSPTSATRAAPPPRRKTPPGGGSRNAGIDALRASLTLLVVFHHAAVTYGGEGSWFYVEIK